MRGEADLQVPPGHEAGPSVALALHAEPAHCPPTQAYPEPPPTQQTSNHSGAVPAAAACLVLAVHSARICCQPPLLLGNRQDNMQGKSERRVCSGRVCVAGHGVVQVGTFWSAMMPAALGEGGSGLTCGKGDRGKDWRRGGNQDRQLGTNLADGGRA